MKKRQQRDRSRNRKRCNEVSELYDQCFKGTYEQAPAWLLQSNQDSKPLCSDNTASAKPPLELPLVVVVSLARSKPMKHVDWAPWHYHTGTHSGPGSMEKHFPSQRAKSSDLLHSSVINILYDLQYTVIWTALFLMLLLFCFSQQHFSAWIDL